MRGVSTDVHSIEGRPETVALVQLGDYRSVLSLISQSDKFTPQHRNSINTIDTKLQSHLPEKVEADALATTRSGCTDVQTQRPTVDKRLLSELISRLLAAFNVVFCAFDSNVSYLI